MSFEINTYQQITLGDSYLNASNRVRKIIGHSWYKGFLEVVFPDINEERFFCFTQ